MISKIKRQVVFTISLVFLLMVPFPLSAGETIILKSGEHLEGVIINQSVDWVEFRDASGVRKIEKRLIKRIYYAGQPIQAVDIQSASAESIPSLSAARKKEEENKKKEAEKKRAAEEQKPKAETVKKVDQGPRYNESQLRALLKGEESVWGRMHRESRLDPGDELAEEETGNESSPPLPIGDTRPSRLSAFLRSAIIPGWGQWSQGRNRAAAGYGSLTILAAATAGGTGSAAMAASSKYKNTSRLSSFSVYFIGDGVGQLPVDPTPSLGVFGGLSIMDFYLGNQRNAAYSANTNARNTYYAASVTAATLYIANLVDVLLFHPEEPGVGDLSASMGITPEGETFLSLTFRF